MTKQFVRKNLFNFSKYRHIYKQFTKKKDSLCKTSKYKEKYDIFLIV